MRIGRINGFDQAAFEQARECGMAFVEICCNDASCAERVIAQQEDIRALVARTGVDVSSIGRWNHTIQEGGRLRAQELDLYLRHLDAAMRIGAKTFVCGCNYDASVSLYKNYGCAIELFGTLTERAAGSGTRVAVQNCHWNNFIVSPEQWRVVLGELPALGLKYDPSHAYADGRDYVAELSDWGDRVYHMHIKGIVRAGRRAIDDPPAGMDALAWREIFAVLYARGYDGDLSIEPHSHTWQGARGMAGVAFTKRFIEQFLL